MRILLVEAEQACLSSLYLALSQHQFGVDWVSQYRRGAIAHLSAATIKTSLVVKPMVVAAQSPLTLDDYLQLEAESPIKRESINGDVYAMAGATDAHVTIALNLAALLRNHVRGTGCRVYIGDRRHTLRSSAFTSAMYFPIIPSVRVFSGNFLQP